MAGGRPIKFAVIANAQQARRELRSFGSEAEGLGSKIRRNLGGALALAGTGLLVLGATSIKAASDAQQSIGAVETIFGKAADSIIKNSRNAATEVGLSANQYRELAATSGALFSNMGVSADQLAGKTDALIRTGADLAATFGGTVTDSVNALSSAFKGEFDPLERYGISIKESDVAARLAAKGQDKLTGAARKQARQLAITDLITQQTKKTQGAFARETDTLAHKQQVLAAKFANLKEKLGTVLLPVVSKFAEFLDKKAVPAVEKLISWVQDNADEFRSWGDSVAKAALPPLKTLAELVKGLAGLIAGIPGPVRQFGLQAGIAALAWIKLNQAMGTVKGWGASVGGAAASVRTNLAGIRSNLGILATTWMTSGATTQREAARMATAQQSLRTQLASVGQAARGAAGMGGMLLLTAGMSQSNKTAGTLMTTLGGAATGFAAGGPIGGAVGALGGLFFSLSQHTKTADTAADNFKLSQKELMGTLDQTTGAITRQTEQLQLQALQKSGALKVARDLGFSDKQTLDALNKEGPARALLTQRVNEERAALAAKQDAMGKELGYSDKRFLAFQKENHERAVNLKNLDEQIGKTDKATLAQRRNNIALSETGAAYDKIPKSFRTKFESANFKPSLDNLVKLGRQHKLTPKQIKMAADIAGIPATIGKIQKLSTAGGKAGKETGKQVNTGATNELAKLPGQLGSKVTGAVNKATGSAKGPAKTGGRGVGSNMGSGINGGLGSWLGTIIATARRLVSNAMAAARAEADIHSPSRKTYEIGRLMGVGLALGLSSATKQSADAAKRLVTSGLEGINTVLGNVESAIKARAEKLWPKNAKKAGIYAAARMRMLKDEFDALRANGRAQEANSKTLEAAREKLKSLQEAAKAYHAALKQGVISSANITQLGRNEDGSTSFTSLVDQMKQKVRDAQRVAELINKLKNMGLNGTNLQQILDEVASGSITSALSTAEALVAGGQSTVNQVNQLNNQLQAAGQGLANNMTAHFHQAGIQAAQGMIKGLEAEAKKLDQVAINMANALVKAMKQALGIKSPSRVFKGLGRYTVEGLVIGLDGKPVQKQAVKLADAVTRGFGEPALAAHLSANGSAGGRTYQINVTAPVGSSSADIGRELVKHITSFEKSGGRRVA